MHLCAVSVEPLWSIGAEIVLFRLLPRAFPPQYLCCACTILVQDLYDLYKYLYFLLFFLVYSLLP